MMEGVVLPLIPLFGIRRASLRFVSLLFGLMFVLHLFLALLGFLGGPWIQVDAGRISGADIAAWPYSVGMLVRFTSFLGVPCIGPASSDDLGHFDISILELLIFFEQWAGRRLLSEKVSGPHVGANRPILIPSVLCQRELNLDMGVSSLVVWSEH